MLDTLARAIGRHPWWVCAGWLAAVLLAVYAALLGGFSEGLFDRLSNGGGDAPGQARTGAALLERTASTGPSVLLLVDGVDPGSVSLRSEFAHARRDVSAIRGVLRVADPFSAEPSAEPSAGPPAWPSAGPSAGSGGAPGEAAAAGPNPFIALDGRAVLMTVDVRPDLSPRQERTTVDRVTERLEEVQGRIGGSRVTVGGEDQLLEEVTSQSERDLRTGESIALPVSLLIMVIVFGGFVAAGLPILGAIASIAGALATLLGFSYVISLDVSTVNVVTVLGLGLSIDYGLLLVSRYREELRRLTGEDPSPPDRRQREVALARTMGSAGRTVLFSGVTVAVSLAGLLVFRADFLQAIGAAGVSIVVVALLVALTLVPALLAVAGGRMIRPGLAHRTPGLRRLARRFGDVAPAEGVFSRLARGVQRHPALVLVAVAAVLLACSLPVLRLHPVASGTALLPRDSQQRQLFDTLQERFPRAATPPLHVVVDAPLDQACDGGSAGAGARCPLVEEIARVRSVSSVDPPREQGDDERGRVTVIGVRLAVSESDPAARDVVRDIRAIGQAGDPPGDQAGDQTGDQRHATYTTGSTAALVDLLDDLAGRAPLAAGIVVLATFVLLFLMTGSLFVPLKALLANILSLGASLGVLVWAFQDGALEEVLGFTSPGGIETVVPPLALTFGFGLAMDYEVFLLSRIAEFRRQGHSNDEAVVLGLQRSGRIITSAALIMVVVFAGFVGGQLLVIKEMGVAMAVAVTIDASLVRMLLVPATMTLLGEWNWWAPAPLRRMHARYGLSDH